LSPIREFNAYHILHQEAYLPKESRAGILENMPPKLRSLTGTARTHRELRSAGGAKNAQSCLTGGFATT
jgi:hypothetical protein